MQYVNTVCANNAKCKYIEIYVQAMEQLQYLLFKLKKIHKTMFFELRFGNSLNIFNWKIDKIHNRKLRSMDK